LSHLGLSIRAPNLGVDLRLCSMPTGRVVALS
jgi:hypothetical protein